MRLGGFVCLYRWHCKYFVSRIFRKVEYQKILWLATVLSWYYFDCALEAVMRSGSLFVFEMTQLAQQVGSLEEVLKMKRVVVRPSVSIRTDLVYL